MLPPLSLRQKQQPARTLICAVLAQQSWEVISTSLSLSLLLCQVRMIGARKGWGCASHPGVLGSTPAPLRVPPPSNNHRALLTGLGRQRNFG